jgi:hypothetical protein
MKLMLIRKNRMEEMVPRKTQMATRLLGSWSLRHLRLELASDSIHLLLEDSQEWEWGVTSTRCR